MAVLLNILANSKDEFAVHEVPDAQISIEVGMKRDKFVVEITDNAGGIHQRYCIRFSILTSRPKDPIKGQASDSISKITIEKNMGGALTAQNINGGMRLRIEI